jgi:hypothetical protein
MKTSSRMIESCLTSLLLLAIAFPTADAQKLKSPLENKPYSGGVLMAEALRQGRVHLPASVLLRQGPDGGLAGVLPDKQASGGVNVANEDPIAVNPANPLALLTGANDYSCPSLQGYYLSSGGTVGPWTQFCQPLLSGASGDGDPIVGWDLAGNFYTGGIDAIGSGSVVVVSQNLGAPVTAVTPTLAYFVDKPWLEVDVNPNSPCANEIYVSATQFATNNDSQISVSFSTNLGASWATLPVDGVQTYPAVDQFSDLAIGKDGTVYLAWMRCTANGPSQNCGGTTATFMLSKSTNCGKTWSQPTKITTAALAPSTCGAFYGCLPHTSERVSDIPSIAIDNSSNIKTKGHLYVTTYSYVKNRMRVRVHRSINGGTTWTGPKYPAGTGKNDEFFPWINVSNVTGDVGVTWLDRRNDPADVNYEEFASVSANGGGIYLPNVKLASKPSNPFNDGFGGAFMGDYTGNFWGSNNNLYASWMDTRNGSFTQDFVGGYTYP